MIKLKVFLVLLVMTGFPVLAQAVEEELTVSGSVTDTDWVSSSLTVRYREPYRGRFDEVTIYVPKEAKLQRGTRQITFSDIRQSDDVVVTYYADDFCGFKAKRISDLNQGNR